MNDDNLATLLEQSVRDIDADPNVSGIAWERARHESRRDQIAAVGIGGLAAALVVALVMIPRDDDRSAPAVTNPTATLPTTAMTLTDPHEEYLEMWQSLSQPAWEDERVDQLPRLGTRLPEVIDPFGATATTLSDDPISSALAVAQRIGESLEVRVLGDDGHWRIVDTPGLVASLTDGRVVSLIEGRPISPDGTQLALPQPGSLVLIDLTNASSHRIDVPEDDFPGWAGRVTQWSPDGGSLLVGTGQVSGDEGSWLVDVATERVDATPYNAVMASFAADGTLYEQRDDFCGFCEFRRYDGVDRLDTMELQAELYVVRPAVGQAMAVSRAVRSWTGPKHAAANSDGLLVVDPQSGGLISFMPMRKFHQVEVAELVGWLDDETLLFSVFVIGEGGPSTVLASWNYDSGVVSLLTEPWAFDEFEIAFAVNELR